MQVKLKALCLLLALIGVSFAGFAAISKDITGKVIDAQTKQGLPGASISIADLKVGAITNNNGEFTITNLPTKGQFIIEIKYIGYKTLTKSVDMSKGVALEFALEPSVIEGAEVVVTGSPFSSDNKTNSITVVSLNKQQLASSGSTNIIDAISKIPGVSQVTTGGAISKPVIRGLGYNRVLTMVDGAREEAQQWGDEHGANVDQFSAARVEVLRGPASLLYGSDALGGVINIIDDILPAPGQINGEVNGTYSSNNGLFGTSGMVQGNTDGFVYRGRVSYKNAYGFKYPGARVPNSGFNETDYSALVGFNRSWGYSHLTFSRFGTNIGMVDSGPNADGNFVDADGNVVTDKQTRSRTLEVPFQNINHYRVAWNSNFILGTGRLKTTLAFQNNLRKEFGETKDTPGLNLDLKSYTYDLKYYFPVVGGWEPAIGVQGMSQKNVNKGTEFLIPDYTANNIGMFAYLKKTFDKATVNVGGRFDHRDLKGNQLIDGGDVRFAAFENKLNNVSGSVGFTYELTKDLVFKGNAGSGFRAPNIAELSANGKHEGTFRYEIGDNTLKQEKSLQFDAALEYTGNKIGFSVSGYINRINNYIFLDNKNGEQITIQNDKGGSETLPVYRYVQAGADLKGLEASVDLHPIKGLHFESTFAYVVAKNRDTKGYLPFIPATSLRNELRYEPEIKTLLNPYITIKLNNVFKQSNIDAFETVTGAYSLVDLGIGTGFKISKTRVNAWVSANNLFDVKYFDHLSRYKPAGIYNPGRNISVGISVPFTIQ